MTTGQALRLPRFQLSPDSGRWLYRRVINGMLTRDLSGDGDAFGGEGVVGGLELGAGFLHGAEVRAVAGFQAPGLPRNTVITGFSPA